MIIKIQNYLPSEENKEKTKNSLLGRTLSRWMRSRNVLASRYTCSIPRALKLSSLHTTKLHNDKVNLIMLHIRRTLKLSSKPRTICKRSAYCTVHVPKPGALQKMSSREQNKWTERIRHSIKFSVLRIRIRDPLLFWFLDPGREKSGSEIGDEHPTSFFWKLINSF